MARPLPVHVIWRTPRLWLDSRAGEMFKSLHIFFAVVNDAARPKTRKGPAAGRTLDPDSVMARCAGALVMRPRPRLPPLPRPPASGDRGADPWRAHLRSP